MTKKLTDEGLDHFGKVAASHVGDGEVPGLVALVAHADEVHVEALGSLAIGGPPLRRDSLFRIASTTKPITAAAALALFAEGLIEIDEPVGRLLPELAEPRVLRRMDSPLGDTVAAEREITVRHLLTFTHGFGMHLEMFTAPAPWPIVRAEAELPIGTLGPPLPDRQPDPDAWMQALAGLPLMAQPGERWMYNTGASVLGVLLGRAAGSSLAEVYRSRLFERLGMRDTAFYAADTDRLATCYQPTPGGLEVWDAPDGQWSHEPAFGDGAAGLVSTADDLLAFARLLLRGGDGVLPPAALAEMTSDQLSAEQRQRDTAGFLEGASWGFCQAVVTDGERSGAFGWNGGLGTSWLVDPRRDLVVIVLTQRMFESAQPPPLHAELQEAAYAALA